MSSTVSEQSCKKQTGDGNEEVSLLDMLKARLDEKDAELATIPMVAQEILAASENPDCSLQDLEAIVNKDQVIATKIIKMANSSFYGGLTDLQSLPRAIMRLGFKEVHTITLAIGMSQVYQTEEGRYLDEMRKLWSASIASAVTCRELAKAAKYPRVDEAFLAGLIHDIGSVFIIDSLVQMAKRDNRVANLPEEIFRELLQVLHENAGARLLENWKFNKAICEAVRFHHNPQDAAEGEKLAWILAACDLVVAKMGLDGSTPNAEMSLTSLPPMQALNLGDLEIAKLQVDLEEHTQEMLGTLE
jgi:HD-like signal output (HDOD) protein